MAALFDGVKRMTDDELRMQIAFLRNITFANVAKETGNRVIGGIAGFANSITEAFSGKKPFSYQIKNVSGMIRDDYDKMSANDRIQLEYNLKTLMLEKCRELNDDIKDEEVSDERLSFLIVNEAAKIYPSIEKYAASANKIEKIHIEYKKAFINSLHAYLQKQEAADVKRVDNQIQLRLNEVSMEIKRELQKALLPKEFSGRGIGKILRLERGTKYLERTVDIIGADCFDMTEVNIETAFAAVRGLKRISRLLFAEFIWRVYDISGIGFAVDKTILPSYIQPDKQQEHYEEEKKLRVLLTDRAEAENKLKKADEEIFKIEHKIEDNSDRLELEQRDYEEAQLEFMSLESKKDEYISGKHSDSETKSYYNQVNEKKRKLDNAKEDWAKRQKKLNELMGLKEKLESERNSARINYEVVKSKSEKQVNEKSMALRIKWEAFYFRFKIEERIFERLVIDFTDADILHIEYYLKELHDSRDMSSYAYENISDDMTIKQSDVNDNVDAAADNIQETYLVTYCNISSGKNVKITYKDNEIINIERV